MYLTNMALTTTMLAKRILDLIQASGMTQQDFAKAIGLDPTALSKALSGKRNFKPLEIALIADQAGVPAQHLLSDEVHDPEPATVAARTQPQSWSLTNSCASSDSGASRL
jgi:transcriptional regulator with XRE-family HTH domain